MSRRKCCCPCNQTCNLPLEHPIEENQPSLDNTITEIDPEQNVPFVGTITSGSLGSLEFEDGTYYQITHDSNGFDIVFKFNVWEITVPPFDILNVLNIRLDWRGFLESSNDECEVQAWNFTTEAWDTIYTLSKDSCGDQYHFLATIDKTDQIIHELPEPLPVPPAYVPALGDIFIRFVCTAQTAPVLNTDYMRVIVIQYPGDIPDLNLTIPNEFQDETYCTESPATCVSELPGIWLMEHDMDQIWGSNQSGTPLDNCHCDPSDFIEMYLDISQECTDISEAEEPEQIACIVTVVIELLEGTGCIDDVPNGASSKWTYQGFGPISGAMFEVPFFEEEHGYSGPLSVCVDGVYPDSIFIGVA